MLRCHTLVPSPIFQTRKLRHCTYILFNIASPWSHSCHLFAVAFTRIWFVPLFRPDTPGDCEIGTLLLDPNAWLERCTEPREGSPFARQIQLGTCHISKFLDFSSALAQRIWYLACSAGAVFISVTQKMAVLSERVRHRCRVCSVNVRGSGTCPMVDAFPSVCGPEVAYIRLIRLVSL